MENYNIIFRNISALTEDGMPVPPSTFIGVNAEHQTHDITIDGLYINGTRINNISQIPVKTNEFAYNINLK
jgi:hypothetical protein